MFRISTPMWANGLRLIDDDGVTVEELRSRSRSACNIGGLERWGWVIVGDAGGPRRPGYGAAWPDRSHGVRPTRAAFIRHAWSSESNTLAAPIRRPGRRCLTRKPALDGNARPT